MKSELPDIVSVDQFADLLDVTPRHVRNLTRGGVVTAAGRGKVALKSSVQGLLEHAKRSADRDAEAASRAALNEIRRRREETRLAIIEGSFIPIEEAEAILDETIAVIRLALDTLPARIAGHDWELRKTIETARDAALLAAASRLADLAERSRK